MYTLYPTIPSAPPEIYSTNYRIQHISDLQQRLENEVIKRETLARKYTTASGVVSKHDIALITVGISACRATGVILLVSPPIAIWLESLAGACGIGGVAFTFLRGRLNTKRNKHSEVAIIARTKLNSIADLIDRDGVITSEEFNLVVAEYKKFNKLVEKNLEKGKALGRQK